MIGLPRGMLQPTRQFRRYINEQFEQSKLWNCRHRICRQEQLRHLMLVAQAVAHMNIHYFHPMNAAEGHHYVHSHHKQEHVFLSVFRYRLRRSLSWTLTYETFTSSGRQHVFVFLLNVLSEGEERKQFSFVSYFCDCRILAKVVASQKGRHKIATKNISLLFRRVFEKYYEIVGLVHVYFKSSL